MTHEWPPKCGACHGLGCAECEGDGDALDWTCAGCGAVIETTERPARIGERGSLVCAECDAHPELPGMEAAR